MPTLRICYKQQRARVAKALQLWSDVPNVHIAFMVHVRCTRAFPTGQTVLQRNLTSRAQGRQVCFQGKRRTKAPEHGTQVCDADPRPLQRDGLGACAQNVFQHDGASSFVLVGLLEYMSPRAQTSAEIVLHL